MYKLIEPCQSAKTILQGNKACTGGKDCLLEMVLLQMKQKERKKKTLKGISRRSYIFLCYAPDIT